MMPEPDLSCGLSSIQISRAIGLSRILLIIGLVFLHYGSFPNSTASPFQGLDIHEHSFATWVNSAVLFFFFSVVPLLSMISGWLFFSFPLKDAGAILKKRIFRRFKSLYLPLVFWNAAYLAAFYALFLANPHAGVFTHLNRLNINFSANGWEDYINAIFAITDAPIAFQFWFVRDLFITALVSPIFWLMLQYKPWSGAIILCLVWLGGWDFGIFIRTDVPFFFYMGALVHQKRLSVTVPMSATVGLIALYSILAGVRALAPYIIPPSVDGIDPLWLEIATRIMRVAGVIGCWGGIYRMAQTQWGEHIANYGGLAFFLHSAHWPLLAIVKIGIWRVMPGDNDAWMLVHYATSVIVTVMIGLGLGSALAWKAPKIFALMNGGRLLGQSIKTNRQADKPLEAIPPAVQGI